MRQLRLHTRGTVKPGCGQGFIHRIQGGGEVFGGRRQRLIAFNVLQLLAEFGDPIQGAVVARDSGLLKLASRSDASRVGVTDRTGIERVENRIDVLVKRLERLSDVHVQVVPESMHRIEKFVGRIEIVQRLIPTELVLQQRQRLHQAGDGGNRLPQLAAHRTEGVSDLVGAAGQHVQFCITTADQTRGVAESAAHLTGLKGQPGLLE